MNLFTVLLPYLILIGAILLLKPFMCISKKLAAFFTSSFFPRVQRGAEHQRSVRNGKHFHHHTETVICIIIYGLFTFILLLFFWGLARWMVRPNPTENYQTFSKNANVVVAFSFGIEKQDGQLAAGKPNDSIIKWVNGNTNPTFIIAQKGCEVSRFINPNMQVIEMHPHGKEYVNTFEAAKYAIDKLDSLQKLGLINEQVIIVAHDCQLERAGWIMQKMVEKQQVKFQIIIPKIPDIPFSSQSDQFHTRNKLIYLMVELFISRPRDYLQAILYQPRVK